MEKLTNEQIADLRRLQERLRIHQREMVLAAAKGGGLPPDRMIQRIAELESTIVAVDQVLQDG